MSDISELFQTDPLKLTSADFVEEWKNKTGHRPLDQIIAYYREARAKFNLGEKAAGSTKKMVAKGSTSAEKIDAKGLDDLLNDL